jgi:hypothetical protein
MLASVRNVPFLIWDGTNDELVPVAGALAQAQTFKDLGYRYEFDLFAPPVDHFLLAVNDQYAPAAKFLGNARVNRNPPHVTYVVNPTMNFKRDGVVADHAYWLSGMRLRDDDGSAPLGKIDAFSEGFGRGDPPQNSAQSSLGSLSGGNVGTLAYSAQSRTWGKAPKAPKRDVLRIDATNIRSVKIDHSRAHVSCDVKVKAQSDGPLSIRIPGCDRTIHVS